MSDTNTSTSESRQEALQEMRYPNVTSLYFAMPLWFNATDGGVPWDDLRKILHGDHQMMAKVQNGKNIAKVATMCLLLQKLKFLNCVR